MDGLEQIVRENFSQKRIVIIGDIVADQFLHGTISRVSREAPVFILRHDQTRTVPGAAANAAANVASLGGQPALIGITGVDANAGTLTDSLRVAGVGCDHVVADPQITTTTKVRVLAGQHYAARQQVIRVDYENSADIGPGTKDKLRRNLAAAGPSADAIIVSDYNYGAVFPEIYDDALAIADSRNIPLIVDSRYRLEQFAGATTATPNREEVEQIIGKGFGRSDCSRLREQLGYRSLLVTNGNEGMILFEEGSDSLSIAAVGSAEPVDVTGAGDTVIAAYTLGLASGLSFADAAVVANHAGGLVVMKKGTATVTIEELAVSLRGVND